MRAYILVTGSRSAPGDAGSRATALLQNAIKAHGTQITVIHGAAVGWDSAFHEAAKALGLEVEPWAASLFNHPFARNEFMVKMVAEFKRQGHKVAVWAFANDWASGTGNCARKAREYGLRVVDYGASTERK